MKTNNHIKLKKDSIEASFDVYFFEDKGVMFAYSPALDLYGYGNTLQEAKESFEIVVQEYFDYGVQNNTLAEDLAKHGWKKAEENAFAITPAISRNHEMKGITARDYDKRTIPLSFSYA